MKFVVHGRALAVATGLKLARPDLEVVTVGGDGDGFSANFVARGFAGDPQGMADLIVAGIKWQGSALLEVLSPCMTFRPEEFEWKEKVRYDAVTIENDRDRCRGAGR